MSQLAQFRIPDLSLFQSAVDEVVARKAAAQSQDAGGTGAVARPEPGHPMIQMATTEATTANAAIQSGATPPAPTGLDAQLSYCASLARNYAVAKIEGRTDDANRYHDLLTEKMGDCDPDWIETSLKYEEFLASKGTIPYRVYTNIGDYVIDGKLPPNARVAIVGDWGTGQDTAKTVLAQIARKNPDVVIHMGDVYYSGTDFEMQNYFYNIWKASLDLTKIPTFTLSGNHDMFCGGAPYYKLIDQLGQPASYFCLRNDNWQFVAMDTGLHDNKPDGTVPTYLEDTEVAWVADKIRNAGGRRTVLLSHHQLFAANEDICGQSVNPHLSQQLSPLLPNVDLWLWGHEHNLVVYQKYLGVLGRCIGHGAFPVGVTEIPATPKFPEVPMEPVRLGLSSDGVFYNHGYAIMDLAGSSATISYYQDTDEATPQYTETLDAAATAAP
jgi:3',5'-cyclic AMP phosphodiesterase CpdA